MKERVFLDTNVLVYLVDADDPATQRRVQDLLSNRELRARLILSTQVLQEFYVSVTRKLATSLDIRRRHFRPSRILPRCPSSRLILP
jgi:predicted nucleic acid-binding protein